jgi:hypothetical protein
MEMEPLETARLDGRGTIALARALASRLGLLARKELELAEAEGRLDARHGLTAGLRGGMALVAAAAALSCALWAVIDGLGHVMPAWLAALLLAVLFAGLGGVFALAAAREAREARPRRSLREARATLRMLTRREAR